MASVAQLLANRSNAQKSTGPRTPEGKAVVAQNAVRHGLCAERVVIQGEDPGEFELYRDRTMSELRKQQVLRELKQEVASVKCEVSSDGSALPTSSFTLHTSREPPDGGTTNGAPRQERACETKPICGSTSEDRVPEGTQGQTSGGDARPTKSRLKGGLQTAA